MVCIHCGSKTYVTNSRPQKRLNHIWRRRECIKCHAIFTTEEVAQYEAAWRVRNHDRLRPFSRDKLFLSLYKACQHRKTALTDAARLAETIIGKLANDTNNGVLDSARITQTALVALNRFDRTASVAYAAFHG